MRAPANPPASAYRKVARSDAGLFTQTVNYPIAARLCVLAYRLRLSPTVLTVANLLLGVTASVIVVVSAHVVLRGGALAVVVGVGAWLVWQAAYCCDCADGQLARITATTTAAGGRLDVLCDIAVQATIVAAVAALADAAQPGLPGWLIAVFAGSWMVNMVTSVMAKEGTNHRLLTSRRLAVRLGKLVRDYGFMLTLIAAVIAIAPAATVWLMGGFTVINTGFLLAAIGQATRAALQPRPPMYPAVRR